MITESQNSCVWKRSLDNISSTPLCSKQIAQDWVQSVFLLCVLVSAFSVWKLKKWICLKNFAWFVLLEIRLYHSCFGGLSVHMSLKMFSAFVKPAVLYSSVRQQPAVCMPKDFTEKNPITQQAIRLSQWMTAQQPQRRKHWKLHLDWYLICHQNK